MTFLIKNKYELTTHRVDLFIRFTDQAIVSIGNLLTGLLLARILGPSHFGLFATLWTVTLLALSSHWACVNSPMQTTSLPKQKESLNKMFSALLAHSLCIGVASAIVALAFSIYILRSELSTTDSFNIIFGVIAVLTQEFVRRWLLVIEKVFIAFLSDFIRYVGTCLALYGVYVFGKITLFEAFLIIGFFASMGCIIIITDLMSVKFDIESIKFFGKKHLNTARWLMPFSLLQWAISAAPLYLLSLLVNTSTAGGYRASVYLISPVIVLTDAFETFLPLRASESYISFGKIALKNILFRYTFFLLVISVPYCVIVSFFSEFFLGIFFGTKYRDFHTILFLLAFAAPIQNLGYIKNVQLRVIDNPQRLLQCELIISLLLIVLYLIIPFGDHGQGVAIIAIATQAIKFVLLSWFVKKTV